MQSNRERQPPATGIPAHPLLARSTPVSEQAVEGRQIRIAPTTTSIPLLENCDPPKRILNAVAVTLPYLTRELYRGCISPQPGALHMAFADPNKIDLSKCRRTQPEVKSILTSPIRNCEMEFWGLNLALF